MSELINVICKTFTLLGVPWQGGLPVLMSINVEHERYVRLAYKKQR